MADHTSLFALLVENDAADARHLRRVIRDTGALSERTFDRGGGMLETRPDRRSDVTVVHERRLESGLRRLEERRPDVVLLNLDLPDSSGLETLTTLVGRDDTVPIVVLAEQRNRNAEIDALRAGAEEFLHKDELDPRRLGRAVRHAIERKAHEREQKLYETLIEEAADVNAVIDPDGTIRYVTPSVERVVGYAPEALIGENCFDYIHAEDHRATRAEFAKMLEEPSYRASAEFRFEGRDGSWVVLHARGRNLLDDAAIGGLVVYTHDVTERKEYERRLEQQRERLVALKQLDDVVHGVTAAIIEQSTREEIERIACQRLAESDSYEFAWIGEPDSRSRTMITRASARVDGHLDDGAVSTSPDEEADQEPIERALETGDVQISRDVRIDPRYRPWREETASYGFRSSAAVPISHEGTVYGVLNVYADRPEAFRREEQAVIEHLGEIVGHAIAAAERKRALMSDELVELEFRLPDAFEGIDPPEALEEPITITRAIPVGEGEFLLYGTAPECAVGGLEAATEERSDWKRLRIVSEENETIGFEIRVVEPPIISAVASHGGSVERVVIESREYRATVRLRQDADVRRVIEAVRETHPRAAPVARRQLTRSDDARQLRDDRTAGLTDRQRTVLETAYFSGFFEWPRAASGEEVAESLGISPPTFSQHLRAAEKKIFRELLEGTSDEP